MEPRVRRGFMGKPGVADLAVCVRPEVRTENARLRLSILFADPTGEKNPHGEQDYECNRAKYQFHCCRHLREFRYRVNLVWGNDVTPVLHTCYISITRGQSLDVGWRPLPV